MIWDFNLILPPWSWTLLSMQLLIPSALMSTYRTAFITWPKAHGERFSNQWIVWLMGFNSWKKTHQMVWRLFWKTLNMYLGHSDVSNHHLFLMVLYCLCVCIMCLHCTLLLYGKWYPQRQRLSLNKQSMWGMESCICFISWTCSSNSMGSHPSYLQGLCHGWLMF